MEPAPPARHHHPLRARLAAIAALGLLVLAAAAFLVVAINIVDALIVLGCLFLGTYCAWLSLTRPGRLLLLTVPGLLLALGGLALTTYEHRVELVVWVACVLAAVGAAARSAQRWLHLVDANGRPAPGGERDGVRSGATAEVEDAAGSSVLGFLPAVEPVQPVRLGVGRALPRGDAGGVRE